MKKFGVLVCAMLSVILSISLFVACGGTEPPDVSGESVLASKTLTVDGRNISGKVSYSTENFSFMDDITVTNNSPWVVSTDAYGMQSVATKTVPLNCGENIFYIHVTNPDQTVSTYTVNLYKNHLYTVQFNTNGGSAVPSQTVVEGSLATMPEAPTKPGYDFIKWDYDFSQPIMGDVTVNAKFKLWDELEKFYFYAIDDEITITGVKDKNAIAIVIPDGVTSIGDYAFADCTSLTSVTIGDSVTSIGMRAFVDCTSLTSVTIGDSVTSIGRSAFEFCYKLVEVINNSALNITAGSSSSGYIGYYAKEVHTGASKIVEKDDHLFYTYDGVNYLLGYIGTETELILPDNYNGEDYEIYKYAFCECYSLTSVTIGDSVTSIGFFAFSDCTSLTSITIPDSVTSIGSSAFYNTACYNNSANWENDVLYIGNYLIEAKFSISGRYTIKVGTKLIADSAFVFCDSLTSVTIGDSVTSIGSSAFRNCRSLTSITIPDSVTSIGIYAFSDCKSLTSVTFKNTSGWWVSTSSTTTSETAISASDLADEAKAAKYLSSTYFWYYWKRS